MDDWDAWIVCLNEMKQLWLNNIATLGPEMTKNICREYWEYFGVGERPKWLDMEHSYSWPESKVK